MNEIQLSRLLGWFSLGLGAVELVAARRIAAATGVANAAVVRALGAREIAAGFSVLTQPDAARPLWGRVAGDAMDAAVLATGLGRDNRRRQGAATAMLIVGAATVLDVAAASALTRRETRALGTARRTRVVQRAAMAA